MRNVRMLLILLVGMISYTGFGMQSNLEQKSKTINVANFDVGVTVEIAMINPYEIDHVFLENQGVFLICENLEANYLQFQREMFDVGIGKQLRELNNENNNLKSQLLEINRQYNELYNKYRQLQYQITGNPNTKFINRRPRDGIQGS